MIRYRDDDDKDESDFKLTTSAQPSKKPLITEIGDGPSQSGLQKQEVEI